MKPAAFEENVGAGKPAEIPRARYIKVIDKRLCTGCGNCMLVCSIWHEGASSISQARIYVAKNLFTGEYEPQPCAQCKNPKCLAACPEEGALVVDEKTGARVIIAEACTGCQACLEACLFVVRSTSRVKYDPKRDICLKCDLCGGSPQCVEACPEKILVLASPPKEQGGD